MKDRFDSTLTYERISHLFFDEKEECEMTSFVQRYRDGEGEEEESKKTHDQYRVITVILRIEVWIKKKRKAKTNR